MKCFVVLITSRNEEEKTIRKHLAIYNVGRGSHFDLFQGTLEECQAFVKENKHLESFRKYD